MGDASIVRAAGAVVVRGDSRSLQVLLVHRPAYDDWSHPKGKLDRGEKHEAACLREVAEETGLAVELGTRLQTVRYVDGAGRHKKVRYWLARPLGDGTITREPDDEVDQVLWVRARDARRLLTSRADRRLLDEARELVAWLETRP